MEMSLPNHCSLRTPSSPHHRRSRSRRARLRTRRSAPAPAAAAAAEEEEEAVEIRVCVNRTCARQGSRGVLAALAGLAPAGVAVAACGCLGRCGAGPNLAVLPRGALVGHCGTPARAAQLLADLCGPRFDPRANLEALALRKKGEDELERGSPAEAETLLSQAVDLNPSGGLHFMYRSRSAARLAIGNIAGALADATEASKIAPDYPQAYLSQGDAFLAMEEWDAAEKAYSTALHLDPLLRRSKSFKARVAKLQEKLTTVSASS
ncbi:Hsp70-Hsp90 organizing protein 1 [Ananas comosus]|uniref:Hsp70-Hsp90 organizing protein 1 n=1 Tax=Ananas comosus TaxID=4615 RepID=A0A199VIT6_ANACO|nr:Hsp70-Hsp90 organizing protein 1 [Ananas comosus]